MSTKTRILVVDDEEIVRLSYARALRGEQCNVELAWNGKAALQIMGRDAFDVVLLDLRMPEMDGMAVLKAIKENWPDSEVVVITGDPTVESAKAAVSMGAYDYLTKPLGPDDIVNAANSAMLHKRWALRDVPQVQRAALH
jgi:DNA-binding NtrC family response regulator